MQTNDISLIIGHDEYDSSPENEYTNDDMEDMKDSFVRFQNEPQNLTVLSQTNVTLSCAVENLGERVFQK